MSEIEIVQLKQGVIKSEYKGMLKHIETNLPAINKNMDIFFKSNSQYKTITLDVTELTPFSTLKHILAVIEQTYSALKESQFSLQKNRIEIEKKELEYENSINNYDKELLGIEIEELDFKNKKLMQHIEGAVRKLSFFVTQHEAILKKVNHFTEEEYEKEEKRHHIMTAIKQALCSARARGGLIDEGNHIYLFEIGINGAMFQKELTDYLSLENELLEQNKSIDYNLTISWMTACADRYLNQGVEFAESKGFVVLDKQSLIKELT